MNGDTISYVTNCVRCKEIKPNNETTTVPTGNFQNPKTVGRVLSVDLVGPLPPSHLKKHTWLMVAVDAFSRYAIARSCTRATAFAITEWLEQDIFDKFNIPEKVVTDNGPQFKSEWFATFLAKYEVEHFTTPVYHPQSNQVEATNKSIKQLLRAELIDRSNHTDWAKHVNKVVMRLNTTPRMPTGQSAHYIVYGQEKVMTGDEHKLLVDVNPPVDLTKDR